MTQRVEKMKLSGSADGRPVKIAATATPGTTLHTATSTAGQLDELFLWIQNSDSVDRKVTLELGGVTAPDDLAEYTVPAEDGPHLIVPGYPYSAGVLIKGFGAAPNVLLAMGFVNRLTDV